MSQKVFVAGASGVVGRVLCRLLLEDEWQVIGTTRSPEKQTALRAMGVDAVIVDVFNAAALRAVVAHARPQFVIHQLTDLPDGLDPAKMAEGRVRNTHIREVGTRHLIAAAVSAGVTRLIAQSVAFAYAPGPMPYLESSPLDAVAKGVVSLEEQVLSAPREGIVLRYGKFYGPETGFDTPPSGGPVHVDAAAHAARLALTRGEKGIYNIAENDDTVSSQKAIDELGWSSAFRASKRA